MKRVICYFIAFMFLFGLCGCTSSTDEFASPVQFYYQRNFVSFFSNNCVIDSEIRETSDTHGNTLLIINNYLQGPKSDQLTSPFPEGTVATAIDHEGNTFIITLNDRFSELNGLDLSIACACITKTVSSLTLCNYVEIQIENDQGVVTQVITLTPDDIYTIDSLLQETRAG